MFDLTINFAEIFKGCFSFRRKKKNKHKIKLIDFINSIKPHNKEKTKINMILERLVNGTYDLAVLYYNDIINNSHKIISFYGEYQPTKINHFDMITIPIYENSIVKYFVMVATNKKKEINIDENLINLLKDNL